MCLITVGLGLAQAWAGWLSGYVLFLVALSFIYLPTEWLSRRGEDLHDFGIGNGRLGPAAKQTLIVALCILPLYIMGFQWWNGSKHTQFSARSTLRWTEELRESPFTKTLRIGEVQMYTQLDRISWRWRLKPTEKQINFTWIIPSQNKVKWIGRSRGVHISSSKDETKKTSIFKIKGSGSGFLSVLTDASSFELDAKVDRKTLSSHRFKTGALRYTQDLPLQANRSIWWLFYLALVQFFLVALPEEIFYRGYLQTRFDRLIGRDRTVFGIDFNWESTVLCSALFALAHLMTIPHPARLAVFFPSLLFGWMRRAYGTTLAPALFHALCNVVAQVLWGIYQPSLF